MECEPHSGCRPGQTSADCMRGPGTNPDKSPGTALSSPCPGQLRLVCLFGADLSLEVMMRRSPGSRGQPLMTGTTVHSIPDRFTFSPDFMTISSEYFMVVSGLAKFHCSI